MHSTLFFAEIPNPGRDWPRSTNFRAFSDNISYFSQISTKFQFFYFDNPKNKLEFDFTVFRILLQLERLRRMS